MNAGGGICKMCSGKSAMGRFKSDSSHGFFFMLSQTVFFFPLSSLGVNIMLCLSNITFACNITV